MVPRSQVQEGPLSLNQRRSQRRAKRVKPGRDVPAVRKKGTILPRFSWRAVSGTIVLGLTMVLYLFLTSSAFYVHSVAIGGEKYLTREEIFRESDIALKHIFWIDAGDVEARLKQIPNIADAHVTIGWPPNMVQIIVTEREPALIWEQSARVWVDVNGIVMMQREDRPDLLRILVPDATEPLSAGARIPQALVDGALYLRSRYPNIDHLLYDSVKGLGYDDGRGWTVWFGNGSEMSVKLLVYNAIVSSIEAQGLHPGEVFVGDPDRPYYTLLSSETNS